jgi:hypothetical protein
LKFVENDFQVGNFLGVEFVELCDHHALQEIVTRLDIDVLVFEVLEDD